MSICDFSMYEYPAEGDQMMNRLEIRSLTGLRGIAAVMVMLYHYSLIEFYPNNPLGPCYVAVDLFFILSGFVMAAVHSRDFSDGFSNAAFIRFMQKRFARVYPLYLVTSLVAFILAKLGLGSGAVHPTRALLTNIMAVQNLGPGLLSEDMGQSLNGASWSISTELGAYILFPWLAMAVIYRCWRFPIGVLLLSVGSLVLIAMSPDSWLGAAGRHGPLDVSWGDTAWPLIRCIAGFSLGLVIYRLSCVQTIKDGARVGWGDAGVIGMISLLWFIPGADVLITMMFPLLILQICTDRSPLARALGRAVPHFLGELSYAIYLIHIPALSAHPALRRMLTAAGVPHPQATSFAVLFCAVLIAAWIAFNVIEKPLRGLFQNVLNDGSQRVLRDSPRRIRTERRDRSSI